MDCVLLAGGENGVTRAVPRVWGLMSYVCMEAVHCKYFPRWTDKTFLYYLRWWKVLWPLCMSPPRVTSAPNMPAGSETETIFLQDFGWRWGDLEWPMAPPAVGNNVVITYNLEYSSDLQANKVIQCLVPLTSRWRWAAAKRHWFLWAPLGTFWLDRLIYIHYIKYK